MPTRAQLRGICLLYDIRVDFWGKSLCYAILLECFRCSRNSKVRRIHSASWSSFDLQHRTKLHGEGARLDPPAMWLARVATEINAILLYEWSGNPAGYAQLLLPRSFTLVCDNTKIVGLVTFRIFSGACCRSVPRPLTCGLASPTGAGAAALNLPVSFLLGALFKLLRVQ